MFVSSQTSIVSRWDEDQRFLPEWLIIRKCLSEIINFCLFNELIHVHTHLYNEAGMEVRGQVTGVGSLLSCGSKISNLNCQALSQMSLLLSHLIGFPKPEKMIDGRAAGFLLFSSTTTGLLLSPCLRILILFTSFSYFHNLWDKGQKDKESPWTLKDRFFTGVCRDMRPQEKHSNPSRGSRYSSSHSKGSLDNQKFQDWIGIMNANQASFSSVT